MLDRKAVAYRYRDYREEPLAEQEIRSVLKKLKLKPREMLRTRDRAFKDLELTGEEPDGQLVSLMAQHPTLLQRPIGVRGSRAVLGRPPESLLELAQADDVVTNER